MLPAAKRRSILLHRSFVLIAMIAVLSSARGADDVDRDLAAITAVGPNGQGAAAAREARTRLTSRGVDVLPQVLAAMDTPNIVAANWCRTIFEEIVAAERRKPSPALPVARLKEYVADGRKQGRARRLVLDLLDELDPVFRASFIPTRLDDGEFREEAVAAVLAQGNEAKKQGDAEAAKKFYQTAFRSARSSDQLTQAAARLKEVGENVNIIEQMGFVIDWQLLGPFEAPEKTGFAKTFPPEAKVDLAATYTGKEDAEIRWKLHHTTDPLGQVDLIPSVARVNEAVAYAYAEIDCPEGKAELRCAADDNLSVWLNGEKVFAREQWLNGTRLDRFITPVTLKAGTNRVLVKICQGPQHANPEVPSNWTFQLRFCEPDGLGVKFKSRFAE